MDLSLVSLEDIFKELQARSTAVVVAMSDVGDFGAIGTKIVGHPAMIAGLVRALEKASDSKLTEGWASRSPGVDREQEDTEAARMIVCPLCLGSCHSAEDRRIPCSNCDGRGKI